MKLYDCTDAPRPRLVRMFAAEKGVALAREQVDPRLDQTIDPEFLQKNPTATVPVLELDDGTCIADSLAICMYLEELHPRPSLLGETAVERAQTLAWRGRADDYLLTPAQLAVVHLADEGTKYAGFGRATEHTKEAGERERAVFLQVLPIFDAYLSMQKWVAGDRFTLADITAFIGVSLMVEIGQEIGDDLPGVKRWFAEVSARPSARA
jgi:glutathione S-transferase